MLGGGKNREWLRPLTPEGNLDTYGDPDFDNMVGCHTGQFIGLNVPNAEPGYEYVWENRKSAEIMKASSGAATGFALTTLRVSPSKSSKTTTWGATKPPPSIPTTISTM